MSPAQPIVLIAAVLLGIAFIYLRLYITRFLNGHFILPHCYTPGISPMRILTRYFHLIEHAYAYSPASKSKEEQIGWRLGILNTAVIGDIFEILSLRAVDL